MTVTANVAVWIKNGNFRTSSAVIFNRKQTNMKPEFFFKIKFITLLSPVTANVALLDQNCSNMT